MKKSDWIGPLVTLIGAPVITGLAKWPPHETGDWATWAGSFGTIAAVFAAILLAREDARRRMRERQALIKGIQGVLRTTSLFVARIENGSLYRSSLAPGAEETIRSIYVATINRSAREIYDILQALTLDKLAEIDAIDAVLYARQGMKELIESARYYEFHEGRPVNQSLSQFQMVRNLIDRALQEMGIGERHILDAAKGEIPIH